MIRVNSFETGMIWLEGYNTKAALSGVATGGGMGARAPHQLAKK